MLRDKLGVSQVAPFTGAWIEIQQTHEQDQQTSVAPFTGAWIEIRRIKENEKERKSLPSRERGLKSL